MAIVPSHFVWQRERSAHHSGAQRNYGDPLFPLPRGPSASPVSCGLCNHGSRSNPEPGFSSFSTGSPLHTLSPVFPHPFPSTLTLEKTPPRAGTPHRKVGETKIQRRHPSCCCAEEVPSRYHQIFAFFPAKSVCSQYVCASVI